MAELDIFDVAKNPAPSDQTASNPEVQTATGGVTTSSTASTVSGFTNLGESTSFGATAGNTQGKTDSDLTIADTSTGLLASQGQKRQRFLVIGGIGLIIASVIGIGYMFMGGEESGASGDGEGHGILAWFEGLFGSSETGSTDPTAEDGESAAANGKPKAQTSTDDANSGSDEENVANPYWNLPNYVDVKRQPKERAWTSQEEESFRAGLANKFVYQRFKTVELVRKEHLQGSESILWDALEEDKFWTRMSALVGLAEFGIEADLETVEKAVTSIRPPLLHRYFKRFSDHQASPSELYVMRQIIRLVDEATRLDILKAIYFAPADSLQKKYLLAASQDPGTRVQRWVGRVQNTPTYTAESPERQKESGESGDEGEDSKEKGPPKEPAKSNKVPAAPAQVQFFEGDN